MEPAVNIMTDIARAHPFTSAVSCKSNTDEAKNASLISSMRAERKELHLTLNYKVTVTDGERKSTKPMVEKNQFAQPGSQLLYGPHASHMRKLIPSKINKLFANGLCRGCGIPRSACAIREAAESSGLE